MTFATLFILLVAIGGPVVALVWWAVAARAAPYDDEKARSARKPDPHEGASVVRGFDKP
ncbi:MAG: hypothetical protein ACF8R7_15420 [Phycisphaerales bacterium JB039]